MGELAEDLSIRELIDAVSDQLLQSQAARIAEGRAAVFEISDLALEISFVVTRSKSGGAGFNLSVVKADGGVKHDSQSVQKITLKLAAVKSEQPDGLFTPVRPRREGESDRP